MMAAGFLRSTMRKLPPIEYMTWPAKLGKPSIDEILDVTTEAVGLSPGDLVGNARRSLPHTLGRQTFAHLARTLHNCSSLEIADRLGVTSHGCFVGRSDRPKDFARIFMKAHVGAAICNEVMYCLIDLCTNRPKVVRKPGPDLSLLGDGDYAKAARRALAGHLGGVVE